MTAADTATGLDELCVDTIRTLSMDAVQKANSGRPGTPMALAPLAYVLYARMMKHNPRAPRWPDRDRFVLSAGHASMLLYDALPERIRRQLPAVHRAAAQGGAPTSRFLQLVADPLRDAEIPVAGYSLASLIAAQAAGDLQTLRAHGPQAERAKLEGDPAAAVRALSERITGLLR